MPNPSKKFLSKAERISNAQLPAARANAMDKKRLLTQINDRFIRGGDYTRAAATSKFRDRIKRDFRTAGDKYSALVRQETPAQKQGITKPSSQVKKAKMSPRKLAKMGDAINTGMTAQRRKILAAIQRLPVSQQRKIYQALEGYAMD